MKLKDLEELGIIELPPARFTPNEFSKSTIDYCEGFNRALGLVSDLDIDLSKIKNIEI